MSKWEISEAAEKRIIKRVAEYVVEERFGTVASQAIAQAIEPENFARPSRITEELIRRWIRDSDSGLLRTVAANYYVEIMHDNRELRQAGRRLTAAIDTFRGYSPSDD